MKIFDNSTTTTTTTAITTKTKTPHPKSIRNSTGFTVDSLREEAHNVIKNVMLLRNYVPRSYYDIIA